MTHAFQGDGNPGQDQKNLAHSELSSTKGLRPLTSTHENSAHEVAANLLELALYRYENSFTFDTAENLARLPKILYEAPSTSLVDSNVIEALVVLECESYTGQCWTTIMHALGRTGEQGLRVLEEILEKPESVRNALEQRNYFRYESGPDAKLEAAAASVVHLLYRLAMPGPSSFLTPENVVQAHDIVSRSIDCSRFKLVREHAAKVLPHMRSALPESG